MEVPQKTISPDDLALLINEISQKAVGDDLAYQKLLYILQQMDLSTCLSSTLYSHLKDLKQKIISQAQHDSEIFRIFCSQVINENEFSRYNVSSEIKNNKFISDRWIPKISETNTDGINNLPKEILQCILRYFLADNPSWTTIENFAMVSKAFFLASIDLNIFMELLEKGSTDQLGLDPNYVISRLAELKYFRNVLAHFSDSSFIDFEKHEFLSSGLSYTSFEITDAKNLKKKFITDNNIKRLAMSSPDLNTLILHGAEELTNESLFYLALRCKHLKTFKIRRCRKSNITHHGLNVLMTCCRKLKNFGISFCEDKEFPKRINSNTIKMSKNVCMDINMNELANVRSSYDPWLEFMTKNALSFKEFELGNVGIDNKFFAKVINTSASILKKISIEKSHRLTLEGISCLMKCKKLQYFVLFDFKVGLEDETLAKWTREWHELRTCAIYDASKITSKGFDSLIGCPKLKKLTLDNYTVNIETINALFYRGLALSLQEITFGSSCFINVKAADIIEQISFHAHLLPKLKFLHFNSVFDDITVDQLEILAMFFPALNLVWAKSKLPSEKDLAHFEKKYSDFFIIGL